MYDPFTLEELRMQKDTLRILVLGLQPLPGDPPPPDDPQALEQQLLETVRASQTEVMLQYTLLNYFGKQWYAERTQDCRFLDAWLAYTIYLFDGVGTEC